MQIKDVRKQLIYKLYASVVEKTPVDTGRARGNWLVSVGSIDGNTTDRKNKAGTPDTAEIAKIDAMEGDETAYIVNNLPYINSLEYGHSQKQAPNGMVGITMQEASEDFRRAVAESGFTE